MTEPYWKDEEAGIYLYLGDMREVLPSLGVTADLILADPPYGETALAWDRWPDGWPTLVASVTRSMWCFGSMRMFLDHAGEFDGWRLSQDVVWEKHNGSGFAADRFKRVHETITHWYRGTWRGTHHSAPTEHIGRRSRGGTVKNRKQPAHTGAIGSTCDYGGDVRLLRSVLKVRSMHHAAIHPTEKPLGILTPLIAYACPPGGLVIDPFAGSGSTLDAARQSGRRAVGIEANEAYCEAAARRLDQLTLEAS